MPTLTVGTETFASEDRLGPRYGFPYTHFLPTKSGLLQSAVAEHLSVFMLF